MHIWKSWRGTFATGVVAGVVATHLAACGSAEREASAETSAGDATTAIVPAPEYREPYGPPGAGAAFDAAIAVREALTEEQASVLTLPIDSPLRSNWSNLPASMVSFDHNGVRLGDLTPEQLARVCDFLAAALGPHGYDTVTQVVAAEAVLGQSLWARVGGLTEGVLRRAFCHRRLGLAVRRSPPRRKRQLCRRQGDKPLPDLPRRRAGNEVLLPDALPRQQFLGVAVFAHETGQQRAGVHALVA